MLKRYRDDLGNKLAFSNVPDAAVQKLRHILSGSPRHCFVWLPGCLLTMGGGAPREGEGSRWLTCSLDVLKTSLFPSCSLLVNSIKERCFLLQMVWLLIQLDCLIQFAVFHSVALIKEYSPEYTQSSHVSGLPTCRTTWLPLHLTLRCATTLKRL